MKLNVGCARNIKEGYINIDLCPEDYPEVQDQITKADALHLPYDDESIDEIWAEHFIEHLTYMEAEYALIEWERVIKNGGKLIIGVPDMDIMAKHWLEIYEKPIVGDSIVHWVAYWGQALYGSQMQTTFHKSAWNPHILASFVCAGKFRMTKIYHKDYDFHLWEEFEKDETINSHPVFPRRPIFDTVP